MSKSIAILAAGLSTASASLGDNGKVMGTGSAGVTVLGVELAPARR